MSSSSDRLQFKRGETYPITSQSILATSYWGNETNPSAWVPVDITNYTVLFIVKLGMNDTDSQAVIQRINQGGQIPSKHSDPVNGKTTFLLSSADTLLFPVQSKPSTYNWEIWLEAPDGSLSPTQVGQLTVLPGLLQNPLSII